MEVVGDIGAMMIVAVSILEPNPSIKNEPLASSSNSIVLMVGDCPNSAMVIE
tara:strand:- start:1 stop:156 length:156 start_codon:yes stop_codon:yes gene_type:complete